MGCIEMAKFILKNIEYPSKEEHFSRGIRALSNIRWHYFKSKLYRKSEARVESSQCTLEQLVTLDDLIRCSEAGLSNHYSCAEFLEIDVETLKM